MHKQTQKFFYQATLRQHGHHIRICSHCLIGSLVLPLSPMNLHPAKHKRKKGELILDSNIFSTVRGAPAGCRGDSRGYPRVALALRVGTRGLSLDIPHLLRADRLEVDAHPQTHKKTSNEVLKCKTRGFVLTWSKQKSVSSTVALGITIFGKGGLLALESISKSAMVIMSCQLLCIDFLASFVTFLGPFIIFFIPKTILTSSGVIWEGFDQVLGHFSLSFRK
jgi:hypothetical protein